MLVIATFFFLVRFSLFLGDEIFHQKEKELMDGFPNVWMGISQPSSSGIQHTFVF